MFFRPASRCRFVNYRFFCSQKKNYYDVLGVPRTATKQEIKDAFVTLSKKYHPDAGGASTSSGRNSADEFVKVHEAYKVLSKDESRRQYDRSLDDPMYPSPFSSPKQSPRYEPPSRPPPFDSPFNERRRPFDEWNNWRYKGNDKPFDDPWLNEYLKRGKPRPFTPEELRRGERAFWTIAFMLILFTLLLNYFASSMITSSNGDQLDRHFQRELYEQNRRRAWEERLREEQRFRQKIIAEQETKKRRQQQQEEEEKRHRIDLASDDKFSAPPRDSSIDDAPK